MMASTLLTDLIGYWKFDENTGTTAYDSLSTNDCALSDITWTTGKINYALYFKGPTTSSLADPTLSYNFNNDFSFNTWIKLDDITHNNYPVFGGFIDNGNYFMVLHRADMNGMVMQYKIVSTTSFTRSLSVSAKEYEPTGVTFKTDGTEMYILGENSDSVHQYTLSTAWNISTASFTRSFSVSAKDTEPRGVTFKSDGTEMYIIGPISDSVHQYTLSTAWNISTASFTRSFSVSAKETAPNGVTFKTDGTEMYIIGYGSESVHQYTLSTAWNISTASFTKSLSVSAKETNPRGVTFKSDGTEMYIIGPISDSVHQYTLSTAWNISTASFTRSFSVSAKEDSLQDVTFKTDGTEMYIIGYGSDSVHQYTLSAAWNISGVTSYITTNSGNDTNFNMITVTRSGNDVVLYVNGVSKGTGTISGTFPGSMNLTIGKIVDGSTDNIMKGIIDEPGFWSRALSQEEITKLYMGGAGNAYPFEAGASLKYHNGSTWVEKPVKYHDGTQWKSAEVVKHHNGSTWVDV